MTSVDNVIPLFLSIAKESVSMRPWIKPFVAGVFTSAALLAGVAAWSESDLPQPPGMAAMHHRHGDPEQHLARFRSMAIRHLDLDAAQTARLDALIGTLRQQRAAMHGSGDLHAQMAAFVQGNAFDRAGAQALADAKLQQARAAVPAVVSAFGDFYDGLRPDQQQKLRDFMARHHGHDAGSDGAPPAPGAMH